MNFLSTLGRKFVETFIKVGKMIYDGFGLDGYARW